jgi:predicted anti-sigma-YlaC factor YlaD
VPLRPKEASEFTRAISVHPEFVGSVAATPPSEGRIQPTQPRRLLLIIRSARPTLAEVPLADLSFVELA